MQGRAAGPQGNERKGGLVPSMLLERWSGAQWGLDSFAAGPTFVAPCGATGTWGPSAPTGEARPPRPPPRAYVLNHPAEGRPPRCHRGGHRAAAACGDRPSRGDGRSPVRRA